MYYFIGIKGTGMAALASILHDEGNVVEGSDLPKHFFTQQPLDDRKIKIYDFDPANIRDNMNVIIGNAFGEDFPEVKAARENPTCKCWRYHEFLGYYLKKYHSICIAGSHGKTTTTGMCAAMLGHTHKIGYLIGDGTGYLSDQATDFVLEADEFRRHFLAYDPDYAVITNMDWDHVDYYKTNEDYIYAYQQFAERTRKAIIAWGEDPYTRGLKARVPIYYYGTEDNDDVQAVNVEETPQGMHFDVIVRGEKYGHFDLPFVGHHLLLNSLSVIMVGYLKGMSAREVEEGLSSFQGVKRRFKIEDMGDNIYIDDYAHHPTEVKITLQAARLRYPDRKIVAVFKPHRTGRVYHFVREFAEALMIADEVGVCEFTSIDDYDNGADIDITFLAKEIPGSHVFHETDEDARVLAAMAPAVYVFMSSKDIYPFKEKLKKLQYGQN
ncbi:MAG: UDP-N-acetylmuramate--L-alanine ligase [Erysipelotrichaceae bacterium]|nr:UDP-N-acetylmuramate--L-alanine ligase [Erysipelotrichaceae bacterium]